MCTIASGGTGGRVCPSVGERESEEEGQDSKEGWER